MCVYVCMILGRPCGSPETNDTSAPGRGRLCGRKSWLRLRSPAVPSAPPGLRLVGAPSRANAALPASRRRPERIARGSDLSPGGQTFVLRSGLNFEGLTPRPDDPNRKTKVRPQGLGLVHLPAGDLLELEIGHFAGSAVRLSQRGWERGLAREGAPPSPGLCPGIGRRRKVCGR